MVIVSATGDSNGCCVARTDTWCMYVGFCQKRMEIGIVRIQSQSFCAVCPLQGTSSSRRLSTQPCDAGFSVGRCADTDWLVHRKYSVSPVWRSVLFDCCRRCNDFVDEPKDYRRYVARPSGKNRFCTFGIKHPFLCGERGIRTPGT